MSKAVCADCGKQFPEDMRFCPYCGKAVEKTVRESSWKCAACSRENKESALFCQWCGKAKNTKEQKLVLGRCSCGDMTFSQRVFCRSCGGLLKRIPEGSQVNYYSNFQIQVVMQVGKTKYQDCLISLYADHLFMTGRAGQSTLTAAVPYPDITQLSVYSRLPFGFALKICRSNGQILQIMPPASWNKEKTEKIRELILFLKERQENYRAV